MSRKIIIFCLTIFLVLTCSYTVFAEEYNPDLTGSISVTLTDKKQNEAIVGAELSVYYVATVLLDDDGNLMYDYTDDFKQFDTAIDDTELATKLDAFVSQHNVPSTKITTNIDGTALCNGLPLGLYFIKQTGPEGPAINNYSFPIKNIVGSTGSSSKRREKYKLLPSTA